MFSDSMMLGGGQKAAFSIAHSVRLDGVADYFSRTPMSDGDLKKWVLFDWIKPAAAETTTVCGAGSGNDFYYVRLVSGQVNIRLRVAGIDYEFNFTPLFRDLTAWAMLGVHHDHSQETAANRCYITWNGIRYDYTSGTMIAQGVNSSSWNKAGVVHYLGYAPAAASYWNGYKAQIIHVDGAQIATVGETDTTTGSWKPTRPDIADYGTNGFHLDFNDVNDLGKDVATGKGKKLAVTAPLGTLTANGGLIAAFNDMPYKNTLACATANATTDPGWIGAHVGPGPAITAIEVMSSSNDGFVALVGRTAVLELWGNATDDTSTASKLADVGSMTDANNLTVVKNGLNIDRSVYPYLWLKLYANGNVYASKYVAQLRFYTDGTAPNTWIPVSLGAANVVTDTPTNNYFVPSRLFRISYPLTISADGMTLTNTSGSANQRALGTISPGTGKWWYRIAYPMNIGSYFGFTRPIENFLTAQYEAPGTVAGRTDEFSFLLNPGTTPVTRVYTQFNGNQVTLTETLPQTPANIDICFDCTDPLNGKAWIMVDGVSIAGDPMAGTAPPISGVVWAPDMLPCFVCGNPGSFRVINGSDGTVPPVGFQSLCTSNLPTPAIQSPAKHFDVVTYTGTGAAQSITGLSFQPDLVWCKRRDNTESHGIYDNVRGPTKMLYSDTTNAEATEANGIVSFNADGFTTNGAMATNGNGGQYVAWCWKAGGTPVANNAGSIPSQVSANPAAGFSIVSYTGTLSPATIGHGLGASPKLIIVKSLTVGTYDWTCQHVSLGPDKRIWLNLTSGADNLSNPWNGTAPTDTVFTVGTNNETNNIGPMIAYCWAEVPGFSKFGIFTSNASVDNAYVHCGFRPRFILYKRTNVGGDQWTIFDSKRDAHNPESHELFANSPNVETPNSPRFDFTAAGFKCRSSGLGNNGDTYIYAAFAEAPFGGKKTTPAKAR